MSESCFIKPEKPVAYLQHEATKTQISVYKKINRFQRFMIRICFGLKYIRYEKCGIHQKQ